MALAERSDERIQAAEMAPQDIDIVQLERRARTQEKIGFVGLIPALASAVWLCESGSPEAAGVFGTIVFLICYFTFHLPEKNRAIIHQAEVESGEYFAEEELS